MNKVWPHVTPRYPCPICGHGDWCQIGDQCVKCMRIESKHECKSGGWYHFTEPDKRIKPTVPRKVVTPPVRFDSLMTVYRARTTREMVQEFADTLGVAVEALEMLDIAWSFQHNAWAFPMFDAWDHVIGVRLRDTAGRKWAVTGSRQGMFIPQTEAESMAMVCEGPTDTAAALTLGFYAIGRASCNCDSKPIADALRLRCVHRVVIVADNDEPKQDGRMPGISGAFKLKKELPMQSTFWTPCTKDIREFLRQGGTRSVIESDLAKANWKRGV